MLRAATAGPARHRRGRFHRTAPDSGADHSAALEGRDILGLAETGTGKTAALALPVLERLLARRGEGPRVLIVAPTRELASQINEEIRSLARFAAIRTVTVFGGVSARAQIAELRKRPEVVVGCPGRLLDLKQQGVLRLDRIETLVLDEALVRTVERRIGTRIPRRSVNGMAKTRSASSLRERRSVRDRLPPRRR